MIVKDLTCASDAVMILADIVVLRVCPDDCMDTEMLTQVNVDAMRFVVRQLGINDQDIFSSVVVY